MSRPLRFSYPHAVHHVTLRCNNREFLFDDPAWTLFAEILQEARRRFRLALYQFCLMTNHVHLLFKVGRGDTLSASMHWLGNTFSRRFNKARRRHGHLWEGRFRSTIIEAPSYFLRCMAYVDLNPVRAGIVARPENYPWSGHRALRDENAEVLDLSPLYLGLGPTRPRAIGGTSSGWARSWGGPLCRWQQRTSWAASASLGRWSGGSAWWGPAVRSNVSRSATASSCLAPAQAAQRIRNDMHIHNVHCG